MGECSAAATVFFWDVREQDACLPYCGPCLIVRAMLLAPSGLMWQKLFLDKLANRLAEQLQLFIHPRRLIRGTCHFDPFDLYPEMRQAADLIAW
jgi:hypothetical protein